MEICNPDNLTIFGLILNRYFEGKEDEVKMQSYRPGKVSENLRVKIE